MGKIYRSARPDRRNAGDVVSHVTGSLVCRPWVLGYCAACTAHRCPHRRACAPGHRRGGKAALVEHVEGSRRCRGRAGRTAVGRCRRHPRRSSTPFDPDDYADLTVRWLKAGLFAGVVAAVVCWIIGTWFMSGIGQASLPIEIIAGGSFTALLVYAPAFVGFSFGRAGSWRRDQRKNEPEEDWSSHEERAAAHA